MYFVKIVQHKQSKQLNNHLIFKYLYGHAGRMFVLKKGSNSEILREIQLLLLVGQVIR